MIVSIAPGTSVQLEWPKAVMTLEANNMRSSSNHIADNDKSKRTYSALDPKLQLWVAATGFGTAMIYRDMAGWFTSPEDQEQLLQEFSTVGTGLQVPLSMWPRTVVSSSRISALKTCPETNATVNRPISGSTGMTLSPTSWK